MTFKNKKCNSIVFTLCESIIFEWNNFIFFKDNLNGQKIV